MQQPSDDLLAKVNQWVRNNHPTRWLNGYPVVGFYLNKDGVLKVLASAPYGYLWEKAVGLGEWYVFLEGLGG
jgi:ABC-type phosphate transport system auxiliary subunit